MLALIKRCCRQKPLFLGQSRGAKQHVCVFSGKDGEQTVCSGTVHSERSFGGVMITQINVPYVWRTGQRLYNPRLYESEMTFDSS